MSYQWTFEAPPGTDGMLQRIWYSLEEKKWKVKCKGTYTVWDMDKFNNSNMNNYDKSIINLAIKNNNLLLHPTVAVEEDQQRFAWHEAARWTYLSPGGKSLEGKLNQILRIYCEKVLEGDVQKYVWFVQGLNRRIYKLRKFERTAGASGLSVQDIQALLAAKEKESMTNRINLEHIGYRICSNFTSML
jgi:hypothetical protein